MGEEKSDIVPSLENVTQANNLLKIPEITSIGQDLSLAYERLDCLKKWKGTRQEKDMDSRIVDYLTIISKLREQTLKYKFDVINKQLKQNIAREVGMAAINLFMPYVPAEKKDELARQLSTRVYEIIKD